MRFASLGSGSKGNSTLIEYQSTCIMVDNGFSVKELELRIERLGKTLDQLTAILVTHEHGDHIRGVGPLARKYQLPVYMTHGTYNHSDIGKVSEVVEINCHESFRVGELEVMPFPVPHDAREPCQFTFQSHKHKLGLLTDTGSITAHIQACLSDCDALIIECNHDLDLLEGGEYPPSLKARVGGDLGHLNNDQAAELLQTIVTKNTKHLAVAHLSEKHNSSDLVKQRICEALECEETWINVIDQYDGLTWQQI